MPAYKDKKTGSWYVSFRAKDPITQKSKKVLKRGFATRREAIAWETQARLDHVPSTGATYWDIFQTYLDNNDTSAGTRAKKESWIRMYFGDLKDKPITSIKKADLITWRNELKESGLAVKSMNDGLQYIRSVFRFYADVYGGTNTGSVLKNFKAPRSNKKNEIQVWSVDEFNRFAECVENPVMRNFFTFMFWTGCRRGEAIALTADCIDGDKVHIYRSMKHFKNGFQPLKTDSSERTIRVDKNTAEMLQKQLETANPFVFGSVHGIGINMIDRHFKKAVEASGVTPIRLHDLRHSHASILLNNGVNILAVSKRLGHSNVRTTLETYAHLLQETDDQMMEIIENLR